MNTHLAHTHSESQIFFSGAHYLSEGTANMRGRNPYNPGNGYRYFLDQLNQAHCLFCKHKMPCPLNSKTMVFDIMVKLKGRGQLTYPMITAFVSPEQNEVGKNS